MKLRLAAVALLAAAVAPAAVNTNMLVSADWLAQHLNDAGVAIVHVGGTPEAYAQAHIPGARYLAQTAIVTTRNGVPNELPETAALKAALEAVGVSDSTRVIFYSDGSPLPATRAWFTMDYLGHGNHAALLDGGLAKWKAENRAMTNAVPAMAKASLTVKPQANLVYSLDAVKALSQAAKAAPATLLDVRTAPEFGGEKGSHIPGSLNAPWQSNQLSGADSTLKNEETLRQLYAATGITPAKPVVVYCNSGMQATQSYFTLKYLGYDARLYDGSLSEWNAQQLPTEK